MYLNDRNKVKWLQIEWNGGSIACMNNNTNLVRKRRGGEKRGDAKFHVRKRKKHTAISTEGTFFNPKGEGNRREFMFRPMIEIRQPTKTRQEMGACDNGQKEGKGKPLLEGCSPLWKYSGACPGF